MTELDKAVYAVILMERGRIAGSRVAFILSPTYQIQEVHKTLWRLRTMGKITTDYGWWKLNKRSNEND